MFPEPILCASFENKTKFDFEHETFDRTVIFFLEKGEYEYSIAQKSGIVTLGEAVICPPNTDFFRKVISPVYLRILHIVLPNIENIRPEKIRIHDVERIKKDFSYLPSGIKYTFSDIEKHFLADIWYTLLSEKENQSLPHDRLMEEVKQKLTENISRRMNIGEVANTVGLSEATLSRRFKRVYKMTPSEYLIGKRIELSKKYLCETSLSLSEIAEKCGYENEYYFSQNFKKNVGVPPGMYRKSLFF